jgi:2-polyprenyl-6-methoxyphenol hydroxylase-like FAD-dependent oxidoreductase
MDVSSTDVFVIGGGPAGLAAAIGARRRGFDVTLADPCAPGHDKACGEGLMPDGIEAARSLGIDLESNESYPFRGIRFCAAAKSATSEFPQGGGLGIRRTVLHRALAEHAAKAGVRTIWGRRVESIGDGIVEMAGHSVRARFIVGADGGRSRVRAWSGLERTRLDARRFGFRCHFAIAPWTPYMEVHWSKHAQLYLTPVSDGKVCVALISRDPHLRIEGAMHLFPQAAARLRGASANDVEQGAVTASRRLHAVTRGCIALVGDASGSVDAITGQGLCLAMQQSAALADAMAAGELALYQAAHDRLMRRPRFMAGLMLALDGREWMQHCIFEAMRLRPQWFDALLAYHVGAFA